MKRRNFNNKEKDQLQKLRAENERLKKQVSSLRKQLARVDLDRYSHLKDLIDAHDSDENQRFKEEMEQQKKTWECFDCNAGILRLVMVSKCGVPHYFRKCDNCDKKTKMQRFDENVQQDNN